MSKLLDAYFILGVAPAIALTAVQERYKWLASVYHPDRFTAAKKNKAEEEIKRVNDARDTIKQHFAITHPNTGAQCHCFKIILAAFDNATENKDATPTDGCPLPQADAEGSEPVKPKQQGGSKQHQDQSQTMNNEQQYRGFNSEEQRAESSMENYRRKLNWTVDWPCCCFG